MTAGPSSSQLAARRLRALLVDCRDAPEWRDSSLSLEGPQSIALAKCSTLHDLGTRPLNWQHFRLHQEGITSSEQRFNLPRHKTNHLLQTDHINPNLILYNNILYAVYHSGCHLGCYSAIYSIAIVTCRCG